MLSNSLRNLVMFSYFSDFVRHELMHLFQPIELLIPLNVPEDHSLCVAPNELLPNNEVYRALLQRLFYQFPKKKKINK